jgi:hypothetical protein
MTSRHASSVPYGRIGEATALPVELLAPGERRKVTPQREAAAARAIERARRKHEEDAGFLKDVIPTPLEATETPTERMARVDGKLPPSHVEATGRPLNHFSPGHVPSLLLPITTKRPATVRMMIAPVWSPTRARSTRTPK